MTNPTSYFDNYEEELAILMVMARVMESEMPMKMRDVEIAIRE